ncbi:hypothetical protein Bca101_048003 [Brassica carinata]
MVEIKEDQGSYRSCWMFLAIRDGEDQQQLNNDAKKAQIHDEAEEPEMFKAEDGRTWLEHQVKVQRIKESKANEAEVMIPRIRGHKLVKKKIELRAQEEEKEP